MTEPEYGTVTLDGDGAPVCQTITIRNEDSQSGTVFMARCLADPRNVAPPGTRRHWVQHWRRGRLAWIELVFTVDTTP
jgi:hypothetical protein